MDDDHVDGTIIVAGALDHALKLWPVVVHGRGAGLDIFGDDAPVFAIAIGARLRPLIGNGKIDLRLPRRRDPQIEGGADGVGHENLQSSMARPEKRIEQVAEKSLQHVDLGGGDRNLFAPIVDNNWASIFGLSRNQIIPLRRMNVIAILVMAKGNLMMRAARMSHADMMAAGL